MAASTYTLVPRTAVRAFLIAAIGSLIGAGLIVLALANSWHPAAAVIGTVVLAASLLLALMAYLAQRASIAELVLDEDGYTVVTRDGSQSGDWGDVTRITRAVDGRVVTVHEGDEKRTRLQFNSNDRTQIDEILEEMGTRLDAAKGYKPWDGS
ncbi:MAG: hypothetical protein Q4P15_09845 [Propionibacteriaceae bacterium]|nr:hypothetical protein [Propionibacteriaceae bacterium]